MVTLGKRALLNIASAESSASRIVTVTPPDSPRDSGTCCWYLEIGLALRLYLSPGAQTGQPIAPDRGFIG